MKADASSAVRAAFPGAPDQIAMHSWDLSPKEAVGLQKELAARVMLKPLPRRFRVLATADLSYHKQTRSLIAVVITFHWPDLEPMETVWVREPIRFPYVPGLLSFRELPPLINAYRLLRRPPQVFLCDGQGLAHPRKFGLACHLGVFLAIPSVGCAKSRLCGEHGTVSEIRGSYRHLRINGEIVGCVYRSRTRVKPLYISPGHLADLPSSIDLVERCLGRFRIPEPLRQAHRTATRLRRQWDENPNEATPAGGRL